MTLSLRMHYITDTNVKTPRFSKASVKTICLQALSEAQIQGKVEVCVRFVGDEESARLHGEHFSDPSSTDVMTFPNGSQDPGNGALLLGDLAVCIDVAHREANKRQRSVADELILYILHGMLHLLDYDDVETADRDRMWKAQQRLLESVGISLGDVGE
jgi:probable rRNA maturation factor